MESERYREFYVAPYRPMMAPHMAPKKRHHRASRRRSGDRPQQTAQDPPDRRRSSSAAGSVRVGLLLLIEHLHEIAGRFLIQPGCQGGDPETVAADPVAQPG